MIVILLCYFFTRSFCYTCIPTPGTPVTTPLGTAIGINPGRVSWFYSPSTCTWDPKIEKYWWKEKFLNQAGVDKMLENVMLSVTGEKTLESAWDKLFQHFNEKHGGKKGIGYAPGEKVAVKLNLNGYVGYDPNTDLNTISPQFVKSLLRNLVYHAKVRMQDIVLFDPSRWLQTFFWDDPEGFGSEFPHVKCVDAEGGKDYVDSPVVDFDTMFYFSSEDVPAWNISKFPKSLTTAKYLITIDAFRGHNGNKFEIFFDNLKKVAGITETAKNWFGSIYRPDVVCDFYKGLPNNWCPISLHPFINVTGTILPDPMGKWWGPRRDMPDYDILVDLIGHEHTCRGKGLIFFQDALYAGIAQTGEAPPEKFQSPPFNNHWSCSIFASQDFVALDSVAFDFLRTEPSQIWPNDGCTDNYLHEAALAHDPPSKTVYKPDGKQLTESLGCHEHFNNVVDKKYSRNLGIGDGIELVKVHEIKF